MLCKKLYIHSIKSHRIVYFIKTNYKIETRLEIDITNNTLKHLFGCRSGHESTIAKNRAWAMHTGQMWVPTIKMQIIFFSSLPTLLYTLHFVVFLIFGVWEKCYIYKLIITLRRKCENYSKSLLIYIFLLLDILLSLDLQILNKIIVCNPLCFLFSSSIIFCIIYVVLN
jgi:hypothetical protein